MENELEKPINLTHEMIGADCKYIRAIFKLYHFEVRPSSWLWHLLRTMEPIGNGIRVRVENPKSRKKILWDHVAQAVLLHRIANNFRTCINHDIDLSQKLSEIFENKTKTISVLHEIHNLACLLRSGQKARFIERIPGKKTPDIAIEGKGIMECKVVHSAKGISRGLKEATKQMIGYPGEKTTDFLILFFRPENFKQHLETLWAEAYVEVKGYLEKTGEFHGFSFSYIEPTETPEGVCSVEHHAQLHVTKKSKFAEEILRPLNHHSF